RRAQDRLPSRGARSAQPVAISPGGPILRPISAENWTVVGIGLKFLRRCDRPPILPPEPGMPQPKPHRPVRLFVLTLVDRTVPTRLQTDVSSFAPDPTLVSCAAAADPAAALAAVSPTAAVSALRLGTYATTLTAGVTPGAAATVNAGHAGVAGA